MGGFVFIVVVISPLVKLRSARTRWSLQSQLFFVFVFVSLFHFSTKRARFQLLHALYWQKSADHCCVLFVQPVTVTQWAHWVWSVTPVAASVRVNPTWLVDTVTSVRQEHMDLAPRDASVCFFSFSPPLQVDKTVTTKWLRPSDLLLYKKHMSWHLWLMFGR